MNKKKICWVTPDWFIDVDMPIVPQLVDEYEVVWVIVFPWRNNRFKEEDFQKYHSLKNLSIVFVHSRYFRYDPRILSVYHQIKKVINRESPSLVYFNIVPENPFIYILYAWLIKRKTIFTAHDGSIKSIMSPTTKWMFSRCYSKCGNVNMFSRSQAQLFKKNYPGPQIYVIPLVVKDYGCSNLSMRQDCISFVSFGSIHQEKNIPLIIEAANQLFEEGVHNFKVSINGRWMIPERPEQLIRHPELFELNTKLIPNSDIPNIFSSNYYAIYAYKQMSQSGALKVAFNYYIPVVVSDLPGFQEEVVENVNGFFFKNDDLESLKSVMRECISRAPKDYMLLKKRMKAFVDANYSIDAILIQYKQMIESVINK